MEWWPSWLLAGDPGQSDEVSVTPAMSGSHPHHLQRQVKWVLGQKLEVLTKLFTFYSSLVGRRTIPGLNTRLSASSSYLLPYRRVSSERLSCDKKMVIWAEGRWGGATWGCETTGGRETTGRGWETTGRGLRKSWGGWEAAGWGWEGAGWGWEGAGGGWLKGANCQEEGKKQHEGVRCSTRRVRSSRRVINSIRRVRNSRWRLRSCGWKVRSRISLSLLVVVNELEQVLPWLYESRQSSIDSGPSGATLDFETTTEGVGCSKKDIRVWVGDINRRFHQEYNPELGAGGWRRWQHEQEIGARDMIRI